MQQNAKVINLKVSAEDEFMDKLRADLKGTVWNEEDCGSWYANSKGVITTLWGDNCTNYWRQTKDIDWSIFEIKWKNFSRVLRFTVPIFFCLISDKINR